MQGKYGESRKTKTRFFLTCIPLIEKNKNFPKLDYPQDDDIGLFGGRGGHEHWLLPALSRAVSRSDVRVRIPGTVIEEMVTTLDLTATTLKVGGDPRASEPIKGSPIADSAGGQNCGGGPADR